MSVVQEKIRNIGVDSSIRIALSSNDNFIGYQQEIDKLTEYTAIDLVNPAIDIEKRKFKLSPTVPYINFLFYFNNSLSFTGATFTPTEISSNSINKLNSFFIFDFYDTYDPNTQIKLFITYLTKIGQYPAYTISSRLDQIYYFYVPVSYIESLTSSIGIVYAKLTFYCAKTGKITQFYNDKNVGYSTAEKMYFKVELDVYNKTWKFLNLTYSNAIAKELMTSTLYSKKINDTYAKYNGSTQQYPIGSTYVYETNKYSENSNNIT